MNIHYQWMFGIFPVAFAEWEHDVSEKRHAARMLAVNHPCSALAHSFGCRMRLAVRYCQRPL